jgi:hypothetical protein
MSERPDQDPAARIVPEYGVAQTFDWRPFKSLLIVAGCLVVTGVGCFVAARTAMQETVREHVSAKESGIVGLIPVGASDISYRRGGAFDPVPLSLECSTTQSEFRALAAQNKWPLELGERSLFRFNGTQITIDRAIFYCDVQNGDQVTQAVLDLDTNRMYYYHSTR